MEKRSQSTGGSLGPGDQLRLVLLEVFSHFIAFCTALRYSQYRAIQTRVMVFENSHGKEGEEK